MHQISQLELSDYYFLKCMQINLEIPEGECCIHHPLNVAKPSSLKDIELASRPHIWEEINKTENKFFIEVTELIIESMQDIISLFNLPPINEIRKSILTGKSPENQDKFRIDEKKIESYERIWQDFQYGLIGDDKILVIKNVDPGDIDVTKMPLYQYYMLNAYTIGLDKTIALIDKSLTTYLKSLGMSGDTLKKAKDTLMAKRIMPKLTSPFLKGVITTGTDRVKTEIALTNIAKVKKVLFQMFSEGKGTMDVARYLYKEIGEGKLWYWLRLVRSELSLAINAAFNEQGKEMGVKYEQWVAQSNCCEICSSFDGNVWEFGFGPEPVAHTHPNCYCVRVPHYVQPAGKNILAPYKRDPYSNPYTKDEIKELSELLKKSIKIKAKNLGTLS